MQQVDEKRIDEKRIDEKRIDEKRIDERLSVFWTLYEEYEDYDHKNILGFINDISKTGLSLILRKNLKPQMEFTLKIFPHPQLNRKSIELDVQLVWFDLNNDLSNRWGGQFVNLDSEQKAAIDVILDEQNFNPSINRKSYMPFPGYLLSNMNYLSKVG